jgi:hypothetical protein
MIKIQKVIDSCHKCEFSLVYERQGSQALICGGVDINDDLTSDTFLLLVADNVKHYEVKIPNNCPLETYEPKKETK